MNVIDSVVFARDSWDNAPSVYLKNYFGLDAAIPVLIENKTTDNRQESLLHLYLFKSRLVKQL